MIEKVKNHVWLPKEWVRNFEWRIYKCKRSKTLKNRDFTIITSNCVGTMIYHDLNMPFFSPTINLTIGMNDFVRFAENLGWYMEKELVELKGEYGYPIGMLEDVRINFLHYESFEEAALKWEVRKKGLIGIICFLLEQKEETVHMKHFAVLTSYHIGIRWFSRMSSIRRFLLRIK